MTTTSKAVIKNQFFNSSGVPLSGGKVYTYAAGTSTPLATYTDNTTNTPNANPIILDSRGEAEIWLTGAPYKIVLHDSLGNGIYTTDNVYSIGTAVTQLPFNNSTAIATTAYVDAQQTSPFRNRIINGDMSVSQVNGASSVTVTAAAALQYVIDQWYAYCTGANVTGQQVAGSGAERYVYQLTGAASVTKIGFAQRMEANATYDMNNASAMIGVSMSNSLLTSVNYNVWYANTADTFGTLASPTRTLITSGTLTVSSAYTRQFISVSVPSAATTGIEIEFNVGAQTSGTWKIGRVQFEAVPTGATQGTAFEVLPYETQLRRCQRYLPYNTIAAGNFFGLGQATSTTVAYGFGIPFQVPTRVAITGLTFVGGTASFCQANSTPTGTAVFAGATPSYVYLQTSGASGLAAGNASLIIGNAGATGYYGTGAQL